MDNSLRKIFKYIDEHHKEMLTLWERLVNMESNSKDKEGVDKIGREIKKILDSEGFNTNFVEYKKAGNTLVGELGIDRFNKSIVFVGHMDTVFPKGTTKERPFNIKDGKAYGPGVLDMKGGIVILLYVIKALNFIKYCKWPIKVILSGDEEVGHINSTSSEVFINKTKNSAAVFNCETGWLDNGIVIGRKGVAHFDMEVEGIGGHVAYEYEKGRSAILEIAHKTIDIHNLADLNEGVTFNVGVIEGGIVPNAIPEYAKIRIDVRFLKEKQVIEFTKQLKKIALKTYLKETKTKLSGGVIFKPMVTTEGCKRLFKIIKDTSKEIGLEEPHSTFVGGASDSAYSVANAPTVCSMGVKGRWNHSVKEFALVDSLFERTKLLAACILKLKV